MDGLASVVEFLTSGTVNLATALPSGAFLLVLGLAFAGAQLVNGICQRDSSFHLLLSLSAMLIGGLLSNSLLAGWRIPLSSDIVVTVVLTLIGMTVSGLALLATYRRADF
jgi:hypothetical protein